MAKSVCPIVEDGNPCGKVVSARGMCQRHYKRWQVHGDPLHVKRGGAKKTDLGQCGGRENESCEDPAYARGLCRRHYNRAYTNGELDGVRRNRPKGDPGPCLAPPDPRTGEPCDRPRRARGYCEKHYKRFKNHGDPMVVMFEKTCEFRQNADGYMVRSKTVDGIRTYEWQHRTVMEQMLGRPLTPYEEVHHKNTIRSDNRPENLELWAESWQPSGARPEDLIEYVTDFHLAAAIKRAVQAGRGDEILAALFESWQPEQQETTDAGR